MKKLLHKLLAVVALLLGILLVGYIVYLMKLL